MTLLQNLNLNKYLQHLTTRSIDVTSLTGIVVVNLNPNLTKFDVNKFIVRSKKSRRSMGIDKRVKTILNYRFLGIAIGSKRDGLNTSVLLRNVFTLFPVEIRYPLFSPFVQSIFSLGYKRKRLKKKNYFLKDKPPARSHIPFAYVIKS